MLTRVSRGTIGQLLRFGVSSVTSAAVSIGLPVLLHEAAGIEQKVAVGISQASVLLINFVMIRMFVFRSRRAARKDLAYYIGSAAMFRGLEYIGFLALFELAGLFYLTALIVTLVTSTLIKFVWYRFVFGRETASVA